MVVPIEVRRQVLERDKACAYCGRPVYKVAGDDVPFTQRWRALDERGATFHFDHKVPLAAGGLDTAENICLACPECNLAKARSHDKRLANKGRSPMTRAIKLTEDTYQELETLKEKGDSFCDVIDSLLQARKDMTSLIAQIRR
jgi:hypothetical protein